MWKKLYSYWKNHTIPLALLGMLSSVLLMADLGDGYLWQDEAQSALISRSVLIYGIPKATDGKNSFAQVKDAEYGANKIWKFHPWLPFYATAASYAVFGESTFSARFPSALAGVGAVLLLYWLGFKITRDRKVAFLAGLFLTASVAFLLLATQCRYYGLSIFFSLLGAYGYLKLIRGEPYGLVLFTTLTFLLFHTHYLYCASLFLGLLVYTWFFARGQLKQVITGMGLVTVVNIPAILWFGDVQQKNEGELFNFANTWHYVQSYLGHIDQFLIPAGLLLLVVILGVSGFLKTPPGKRPNIRSLGRQLALPLLFVVFTIGLIAALVHKPYFRYIGPIFPFFMLILAIVIREAMRIHWLVGVAIYLTWLATGELKNYIQEFRHDYYGPMEGITAFLNKYADSQDTVAISYGDLPVKFYTNQPVIGALSAKDYRKAIDAKWVILRHHSVMQEDAKMKKYFLKHLEKDQYRKTTINYPDIPYQNREVPSMHNFKTVRNAPKVTIFKRVDSAAGDHPE